MRKRMKIFRILLLSTALLGVACSPLLLPPASGEIVRQTHTVAPFTAINICCGMHLLLTQGETPSVELEGDEAILDGIEVVVRSDELVVQLRPRFNLVPRLGNRLVTVYVTAPDVQSLVLSGGSQGEINLLQGTELQVTLSGGSQLAIAEVAATTLTSDLSGGAQLAIATGHLDTQIVDASGGSRYLVEEVQSDRAELDFSGGSRARLQVASVLWVDASGGSDVAYHGTPALEQTVSGGSRVRSLGE